MSLVFKIELTERVGSFVVSDITGNWSYDYPYGYGPQNILPTQISKVTAYVTTPDGSQRIFKNLNGFGGQGTAYQFMAYDFGWKAIMSGLWIVRFVIEGTNTAGNNFTYEATAQDVFIKEVECCVGKGVAKTYNVKLNDVFRDDQSILENEMSVLLRRAKEAKRCCDNISANNLITQIRLNCRCGCNH